VNDDEVSDDRTITPAQEHAIEAILAGTTPAGIAEMIGADVATVRSWLDSDAEFIARLNRAKRERAESIRAEVRGLSSEAVATLREMLTGPETPPAIRLRAALSILGTREALKPETIGPASAGGVKSALQREWLIDSLGV
jgi:hypothetical protein